MDINLERLRSAAAAVAMAGIGTVMQVSATDVKTVSFSLEQCSYIATTTRMVYQALGKDHYDNKLSLSFKNSLKEFVAKGCDPSVTIYTPKVEDRGILSTIESGLRASRNFDLTGVPRLSTNRQ